MKLSLIVLIFLFLIKIQSFAQTTAINNLGSIQINETFVAMVDIKVSPYDANNVDRYCDTKFNFRIPEGTFFYIKDIITDNSKKTIAGFKIGIRTWEKNIKKNNFYDSLLNYKADYTVNSQKFNKQSLKSEIIDKQKSLDIVRSELKQKDSDLVQIRTKVKNSKQNLEKIEQSYYITNLSVDLKKIYPDDKLNNETPQIKLI